MRLTQIDEFVLPEPVDVFGWCFGVGNAGEAKSNVGYLLAQKEALRVVPEGGVGIYRAKEARVGSGWYLWLVDMSCKMLAETVLTEHLGEPLEPDVDLALLLLARHLKTAFATGGGLHKAHYPQGGTLRSDGTIEIRVNRG